jgi:iron complex outermembrane receptor protein
MFRALVSRATLAFAAAILLATPGLAQDDPGTDEQAPPEVPSQPGFGDLPVAPPPGIEAIEVTGERMDATNVQDEAQAISAFSGADLDKANIVSVDSLQFNVPGLHVGQSGQAPIITLRGIGTENASLTGEPGVAFHLDGLNVSRPGAARVAFFDLETLEVKRGPQGLVGGKNSTSGHINLISRKPTDEFEATGDVLFGNYDRVRMRGAFNVPLGEYAATRLALYHETRDGYLDNANRSDSDDPFDSDDFGLRAHIALHPTESLDLNFSYNYFKQGGGGPQADIVPIGLANPCAPGSLKDPNAVYPTFTTNPREAACYQRIVQEERFLPGVHPGGTPIFGPNPLNPRERIQVATRFPAVVNFEPAIEDSDPRTTYSEVFSDQKNRYWGWSTHANYAAPSLPLVGETEFKLLGGFQHTGSNFNQDFDATSASLSAFAYDDVARQYTGELQWLGGGFDDRLEWQMSLFHSHETAERYLITPNLLTGIANLEVDQETDNKAYGASLHGTYQLTDALAFNLGGRLIKDEKENWLLRSNPPMLSLPSRFQGCTGNLGVISTPRDRPLFDNPACSLTDREKMWGAGLEWRPFGDDHLLYTRIDRGAKTGGFRAGQVGEYKPERIWAYSLGTKSQFFDQRLTMNLEGFVYNYQDLQIVVLDGATQRTENTDARMYGWDLEASASPIEGSLISAVISYLHTETIDYYSLDPATPDQFLVSRLDSRDLADALAEMNVPNNSYEEQLCLNPTGNPSRLPCGELPGTIGGLDDYGDNRLSRAPEWKYTLSGEYEIPLGRFGSLTPRVQYTWQDDTYFRAFNKDFDLQEAYHLTDVKATWYSPEQIWSLEVGVQNIEDEAPKQNILVGPRFLGSPALAWYSPPRFYYVQVGFKY